MEPNLNRMYSSPLPLGWHVIRSEYGLYYWNEETNVTQWKCPTNEGRRKLIIKLKTQGSPPRSPHAVLPVG